MPPSGPFAYPAAVGDHILGSAYGMDNRQLVTVRSDGGMYHSNFENIITDPDQGMIILEPGYCVTDIFSKIWARMFPWDKIVSLQEAFMLGSKMTQWK